jgi:hypothetical protein
MNGGRGQWVCKRPLAIIKKSGFDRKEHSAAKAATKDSEYLPQRRKACPEKSKGPQRKLLSELGVPFGCAQDMLRALA